MRLRVVLALIVVVVWLVAPRAAQARESIVVWTGRLPAENVREVVLREHGKLRGCYEDGLRRSASLEGVVAARFQIVRDGSVPYAVDGGSDLGDQATIACVVAVFRAMRFAAPPEGSVIVTYPVRFTRYGGGLRREDVRRALAGRLDRVRLCSETARTVNPGLAGTFAVDLEVGLSGVARARDAGSDVASGAAVACVVRALDGVELPAPWEPASVRLHIALADDA